MIIVGGKLPRTMFFYHDTARVDFETELNDIPDGTVVVAEFPLSSPVCEVRRGIPYGFSHAAWSQPDQLVPERKREALQHYLPDVKGHPPRGN